MSFATLATATGLGTVGIGFAAFWTQIQNAFNNVRSILISTDAIGSEEITAISYYVKNHKIKTFKLGGRRIFTTYSFNQSDKIINIDKNVSENDKKEIIKVTADVLHVVEDISVRDYIAFVNCNVIYVSNSRSKITYFKPTFNIVKFLIKCSEEWHNYKWDKILFSKNQLEKENYDIIYKRGKGSLLSQKMNNNNDNDNNRGQDAPSIEKTAYSFISKHQLDCGFYSIKSNKDKFIPRNINFNGNAFDNLFFSSETEEIKIELFRWLKSKNWYKSKGIPWRRGWMLEGKPGTGKSSLIKALAYDYDVRLYVFDVSSMSNDEFATAWKEARENSPCIVSIEDIDAVFKGRENVLKELGGGLSFDCFLNVISGIESSDGIFLIVTTNNMKDLDPAIGCQRLDKNSNGTMISTRPGRIDRVLTLGNISPECRLKMAQKMLCECNVNIQEIINKGDGDTPAQFQERCRQIAIECFWKDKKEI